MKGMFDVVGFEVRFTECGLWLRRSKILFEINIDTVSPPVMQSVESISM